MAAPARNPRVQRADDTVPGEPGEARVPLWSPSPATIESSNMYAFQVWLESERGVSTGSYEDLHRFSVDRGKDFWRAIWDYYDVVASAEPEHIVVDSPMPGPTRFPGARMNFAENILRHARTRPDGVAVYGVHESLPTSRRSWREIELEVGSLAEALRGMGVGKGDRVAAVLPNIPETLVALLATASIGAIWSVVNTDFAVKGVADRFAQIEPKVLFTVDGYDFGGKRRVMAGALAELCEALPSVEKVVVVDQYGTQHLPGVGSTTLRYSELVSEPVEPRFEQLDFDHPLWILYSSGTTGKPKGIVHSHGGVTIDKYKENGLHYDLGPQDTVYFAVSTTWAVWNMMVVSMLLGSAVVFYDGSPTHEGPATHFAITSRYGVTLVMLGSAVFTQVENSGVVPAEEYDLSAVRSLMTGGSPLPHRTWEWVYGSVKSDVKVGSECGGTDVAGAFLGSNAYGSVHAGELMGPHLGIAAETWNPEGERVYGQVGELVITTPAPSMPIMFWGDEDGSRYSSAYFDVYPGVWRHGDWATQLPSGEFIIHGRSDSTINRGGIRMGSGDITAAVDSVDGVAESMVLGVELGDGDYYMPLFVVPSEGTPFDDALKTSIIETIRTTVSPRYVPDEIIEAPAVPRNRTGKPLEVPIKRVFQGEDASVINRAAAADTEILDWYVDRARAHQSRRPA